MVDVTAAATPGTLTAPTGDARRMAHAWRALYGALGLASGLLVLAAWRGVVPLDTVETFAFVTGAWSVWWAAKNSIWTWPIGLLNSAAFVALFYGARLYFDMGINVFYVLSGVWGWYAWSFGGAGRREKPVTRVGAREAVLLALAGVALTLVMWNRGIAIDDAAPFLDALTTALSILAQWLLMRRKLENWFLWIAADLVYVPLYVSRGLHLTGLLYAIFALMCVRGVIEWRATLQRQRLAATGRADEVGTGGVVPVGADPVPAA